MLNKRGEGHEISVEYTIGIVLAIIILFGFAGCAFKAVNPNCDPASVEAFNEFVKYYGGCSEIGDCGRFDYSKLEKMDNIIVEPAGNRLESTSIQLKCSGGKTSFRNSKKIDVGLCFKNGEEIKLADSESSVNIYSDEENDLEYFLNNNLNLYNIGQDRICFVLIGKTMKEYAEEETRKYARELAKGT